ncbi:MAG: thiamine pyrophosphate-dependent dehydrogenase E1 component subunit alpha, partial [Chloroflexi bacterium]|nr:thiamine pyrophosphate-dependent dehydrogenase E1 component subunit alpha [Chloroflexota bacterium]
LYYSQRGQEAVAAAIGAASRADDYLVTTYRGNGDSIAKGARMDRMVAEILGRTDGYCAGKGGVMHIAAVEIGVLGATGVVGGGLPIATGAAYSAQVRGTDQVTFCSFGDGASNQGTFHESLNLAGVWNLPVVFVCQNNQYAEATARHLHQAVDHIAERAAGYGLPGVTIDGMDSQACYSALTEAADRARRGDGATLVECLTYRYAGHYVGDAMVYMPADEIEAWKARDPLVAYRRYLVEQGSVSPEQAEAFERDAQVEVVAAIAFARSSPSPDVHSLSTQTYAESSH